MKLSKWAKEKGISLQTAYRWFHKGLIPNAIQLDTKTIIVNKSETTLDQKLDEKNIIVIYSRVSSHNKKDDLTRQIERCSEFAFNKGLSINKIYKEIASGMNDNRKQMWSMIDSEPMPTIIIIENKDRLTRFGFNYLEKLLQKQGCEIIVINRDQENEQDLIKDMISIITSFCCRLYGLRRGQNKSKQIRNIIDENF